MNPAGLPVEADSNGREASSSASNIAWMGLLSGLTLLFFLSFFNRFAGLRSGDGEYTTGMAFLHGQLPYRDYFSATPPLNTLKSALLLKAFGPYLFVSRLAGVLERVVIVLALFAWLRRLFPARFAFLGSLATIILSAGDRSDPVASYNHDALLFALLSGLAASLALSAMESRRCAAWSFAAGFSASACLLTKQTVGLGAVLAIPVVIGILLLRMGESGRAWRWVLAFFAGVAGPLLMFFMWLRHMGLLGTFATMVFRKGPAAKGGHLGDFVLRELNVAGMNGLWVALALLAAGLAWRAIGRSEEQTSLDAETETKTDLIYCALGCTIVIGTAQVLALTRWPALHNFSKTSVYFGLIVFMAMLIRSAVRVATRPPGARELQFILFGGVSLSAALMLSLSWPAFEAMTLPGMGLLIAALLDGAREWGRRFAYLVLAAMVFLQVREKLDLPFAFGNLSEPPAREAHSASSLPQLAGVRLPSDVVDFVDGTVKIIQQHSGSGDTILTFPEMGLLYELSGRTYPTLSGSHNVDVINDAFAREEALRILTRRPAVVVTFRLSPEERAHEDEIWRFGKPSGQHVLVAAIDKLTSTYKLAGTYQLSSEEKPILVYVRR